MDLELSNLQRKKRQDPESSELPDYYLARVTPLSFYWVNYSKYSYGTLFGIHAVVVKSIRFSRSPRSFSRTDIPFSLKQWQNKSVCGHITHPYHTSIGDNVPGLWGFFG